MKLPSVALALSLSAISAPSWAHEFWIEAVDYTVAPGETVAAALMVGEEFEGSSFAYIPENFTRFEFAFAGGEAKAYAGRLGDRPAFTASAPDRDGLLDIVHVTRDYELTWDSWDTFTGFVAHKDGAGVLETHAERGYPEVDVREVYSRYGKALIAVGKGAGADRNFGMLTEIVALENPYTDDTPASLDVQLFYQGEPRTEAQIEIFARSATGDVAISTVRTDAEGIASVPVTPGTTYLLDAVVFREPADDLRPAFDPMWETLWASLTFAAPAPGSDAGPIEAPAAAE